MNGMTGFHLFTIKGIPIAFSPWFLLLIIILSSTATSLSGGIIFAVVATFGILFHELGHAFTSQHYHLSPKVLLHGWGGLTLHDPAKNNKSDIVITAAGPLVGLVIGGLFCAIKYIMIANLGAEWLSDRPLMSDFLTYSIWVNLGWGIFNLLPIYPMDGGHLLSSALQFKFSQTRSLEITYFVSIIIGVLMLAGSLWLRSFFMIFLSGMMIYTNYVSYKKRVLSAN